MTRVYILSAILLLQCYSCWMSPIEPEPDMPKGDWTSLGCHISLGSDHRLTAAAGNHTVEWLYQEPVDACRSPCGCLPSGMKSVIGLQITYSRIAGIAESKQLVDSDQSSQRTQRSCPLKFHFFDPPCDKLVIGKWTDKGCTLPAFKGQCETLSMLSALTAIDMMEHDADDTDFECMTPCLCPPEGKSPPRVFYIARNDTISTTNLKKSTPLTMCESVSSDYGYLLNKLTSAEC